MEKAIITSVSNKFFPSLINLLGSIKSNYPNHPKIYVYDLGLFWSFRKELDQIENVEVVTMPHFCPFWRSCYTWKTYILHQPLARLNFYMDAGCQVLRPLDEVFEIIEKEDFFTVAQESQIEEIVPKDFKSLYHFPDVFYQKNCVTAGLFGFKNVHKVNVMLAELYAAGTSGMCLGFSLGDQWRNKGVNKSDIIRDCRIFRHDTTMLNMVLLKHFGDFKPYPYKKYGGASSKSEASDQLIWNMRLNYEKLEYTKACNKSIVSYGNRLYIHLFLFLKKINRIIKHALS